MNYSTAVFLINKNVRAIAATYEAEENAPRTIFKTFDDDLKAGDFIVVPTNTRHKMTVCKVVEVDVDPDFDSQTQMAWVVGVVEKADYEDVLAKEAEAIRVVKAAELKKKRDDLRETMFANHIDTIKALPIYANGDTPKPV